MSKSTLVWESIKIWCKANPCKQAAVIQHGGYYKVMFIPDVKPEEVRNSDWIKKSFMDG